MAYDRGLADRIRELLEPEDGITEKAMFGGLAFLVNGNMAVAANGDGGAMARVADHTGVELAARHPALAPMVMRGREMKGWLHAELDDLDDDLLAELVEQGVAHARTLPPK
ncbi:TfoX/Sxy family protein [Propionibacteriaceae bacterium G1746]|uniref:TfoX/Sxy family protein n=1 Tax=Aestuariimicrobium sp. G57 TaxID=3418485 RepID=UPI003C180984